MIDLEELERLLDEDIDLDGEKLTTIGTQVLLTDSVKYAHAFAENNDFWMASVRARLIAAAINAVPELIAENRALQKRVQELEKQRKWLAQKHANACIDASRDACTSHIGDCPICPLPQGTGLCIEVSEVTFINAAEEAAKEAGG